MLGHSQGIYALILTASIDLSWWSVCSEAHKKKKPTFLRDGGNQFREYWTNLTTLPHKCFQKGSWTGKNKKNNIYRRIQISDPLYTIWAQQAAKAAREASKTHQEEAVRAWWPGWAPCCLWPGQAAGASPCSATAALGPAAHKPSPEQRPWHGRRNEAGEGQQTMEEVGTLIFVFVYLCLLLQPDLVPKGIQQ